MRHHFAIVISRVDATGSPHLTVDDLSTIRRFVLGNLLIEFYTPGAESEWVTVQEEPDHARLSILEGFKLPGESDRAIQPGTYNEILANGREEQVVIRNDALGVLPLFTATVGQRLVISNSARRIQEMFGLPPDEAAVAQWFLLAGWIPGGRTLISGVSLMAAGTEYRFDDADQWRLSTNRLSRAWSGIDRISGSAALDETVRLWRQAMGRTAGIAGQPTGILLSGGLDSRMVAGGLTEAGVSLVCLTHGNTAGDEAQIAKAVATTLDIPWIPNDLNEAFPYEDLNLVTIQNELGGLLNPIWDSSAAILADRGIRSFTTGAGLDRLLGGRTDRQRARRFLKSLGTPILALRPTRGFVESDVETIAAPFDQLIIRRAKSQLDLVAQPYRDLIRDQQTATMKSIRDDLRRIAAQEQASPEQVNERFVFEGRMKQLMALQELQLARFGTIHVPTYDLDLVEFLTNLPPAMKYDHTLYYQVIRRLYPALAAIPVTNLGVGVNHSRVVIESSRAWRIVRGRRLSSWINFEEWLKMADHLDHYRASFQANSHFFEVDEVNRRIEQFERGERRLYDGNELFSFLSLAMALQPTATGTSATSNVVSAMTAPPIA